MLKDLFQILRVKRASLISSILLYFIISLLVIGLVLGISFTSRIKPYFQNDILPNVARYIQYVVEDIGSPPDLEKAKRLASELPFELRIEGKDIAWSSNSDISAMVNYQLQAAPYPYDEYQIGEGRYRHFVVTERQGYRFMFVANSSFESGSRKRHWILFLLLAGTLFILYLAIRRLFKPIESISSHLSKISGGNFEGQIEITGENELAQLATGINDMSAQIKSMLDSKAGLLLAISHELRSPLTRMRVNLELLDKSNTQQALIEDIHEMEHLVTNILESERLGSHHMALNRTECDLAVIIESVVSRYFERQEVILNLTPVQGLFDELRIQLIVKNLLDNACRYTNSKSKAVEISLTMSDTWAKIKITDHGSGISPEDLKHITEAFYRADQARQRNTGGYGIGLYLCKQIVNAHAGSLIIDSHPGKGTQVTVKLPVSGGSNEG